MFVAMVGGDGGGKVCSEKGINSRTKEEDRNNYEDLNILNQNRVREN